MSDQIQELDSVALLRDLPAEGLVAGQTGAVVFVHRGGEAFEVEFPLDARASVVATVLPGDLLKLKGLSRLPIAAG
jgi:hypothetical protein